MVQMNDKEYKRLVEQDIKWLEKQSHSCEKDHILIILQTITQQSLSGSAETASPKSQLCWDF
jgi:hypothetical protein